MQKSASNLFEGYRSVGHVTGSLPFIVRHAKTTQDSRILTIVGKTFHTYTTNLTLVEASLSHESDIRALTSDAKHVYSASGRSILMWGRGSKLLVRRFDNGHQADVRLVSKFGSSKLVAVDDDNNLFNWNISDKEILNIINFDTSLFDISAVCQPKGYEDKILLGSTQGHVQLWNINTEQCIYTFDGKWNSAITCIVQSPVQDVVGFGFSDGHVYILDIKYDQTVIKIYQEYGPITSMSFRLDDQPYLVTSSHAGHLMIWNLEKKRLSSQIRNAHTGSISNCQFVRNESLLVTSGSDNSLKIWTMDMSDGGGTLLCQRSGHSAPPTQIQFYGQKGFNLLSAGGDSTLRMFHMYSERLNRSLGIARNKSHSKKKSKRDLNKLEAITCFAAESAKEKQWDNIVACHKNASYVTTWNYDKCKIGTHFIQQPSFNKNEVCATCVTITACGNFVVIGFNNGFIFKYNLQSGIFRGAFESPTLSQRRAHNESVTGLAVDGLGIVFISCGVDGRLRLWNFKTGSMLVEYECSSPVLKLLLHRDNNLVAIALQSNDIEIRDLETRNLVRKFLGKSKIIDMVFSPDSRWLIVAYADCSIRTWDIQLGKLIDSFKLVSPCTSLSISSTGEFLATAHEDSLGVNIWSNFTIYSVTSIKAVDYDDTPILLDMPFVRCDEQYSEDQEDEEDQILPAAEVNEQLYYSADQLHQNLITTSGLPTSRWKNLLDVAKIREKQLIADDEKKAKPLKVPFFIPVKAGLKPEVDQQAFSKMVAEEKLEAQSLRLSSKIRELSLLSPLAKYLVESSETKDYKPALNLLKDLGPSAIDGEIRSLGPETCGDNKPMLFFLDAIQGSLERGTDYELICSWLALFLKVHHDSIQDDGEVKKGCLKLVSFFAHDRLNEKFNQILSVLNFVRSSIL